MQNALANVKGGKAAGVDGCPGECLTKGGREIVEWLVRLFNMYFREETVPLEWRTACVVPLYKRKADMFEF